MRPTGDGLQDRVRVALYWYLRSNESSNPYSGIVLTQAAVERLAREVLSDQEWCSLQGKGETGKRIRAALGNVGIDCALPVACGELRTLADAEGPRVLVDIRNDLVHSAAAKNMSLEAYMQAQQLGQWYAELLLLSRFEYQGRYANRLTYAYEGKWCHEVVPWAR